MTSTADLYRMAAEQLDAGQLAEADALCRRLLAANPNHAEALHLLGSIAHQAGNYAAAAELMHAALGLVPQSHAVLTNLGLVYEALGRPTDALTCYYQSLAH